MSKTFDLEKTKPKYWDDRVLQAKGDPQALVYAAAGKFAECSRTGEALIKAFVKSGQTFLDVGCGYGRFYPAAVAAGAKYTGFDFSPEMIKEAERRNPGGDFRVADWSIKGEDSYDVVFQSICRSSFPGTEEEFVEMLMRFVKIGGILITHQEDVCAVVSNEGNIFER